MVSAEVVEALRWVLAVAITINVGVIVLLVVWAWRNW